MSYKHRVGTSEIPTSILPAVNTTAGLPVVFGTAPIHLASSPTQPNKPVLCYSYDEAVKAFGYSDDWDKYTLCEAIYAANDDVPYKSPSNKTVNVTGLCLKDGTEVVLTHKQAEYLNGCGIITGLSFMGGWKIFGNRTGCYPNNTDPKDCFLCVRRMFNWHSQTFIQTYWQKLDDPTNRRLIDTVVDSKNIRLNGITGTGALLGGRIEFIEKENPRTSLIDGQIKFHTYMTPPVPARDIENVLEYDTNYFDTLFQ